MSGDNTKRGLGLKGAEMKSDTAERGLAEMIGAEEGGPAEMSGAEERGPAEISAEENVKKGPGVADTVKRGPGPKGAEVSSAEVSGDNTKKGPPGPKGQKRMLKRGEALTMWGDKIAIQHTQVIPDLVQSEKLERQKRELECQRALQGKGTEEENGKTNYV